MAENEDLNREVKSLKETLNEANEEREQLSPTCGQRLTKLMILNSAPASTIWKYTVYRRKQRKTS